MELPLSRKALGIAGSFSTHFVSIFMIRTEEMTPKPCTEEKEGRSFQTQAVCARAEPEYESANEWDGAGRIA
jgi:hypothetical protein